MKKLRIHPAGKQRDSVNNSPNKSDGDKIVVKRKKIVINGVKKDLGDRIKNEGDFIKKISSFLKVSKRCQLCAFLNISSSKHYYCTNFEALWFHRDTQFSHFKDCSYNKEKSNKLSVAS